MGGPTGTDPQYEAAADAALSLLRQQFDSALSKNGLTRDNLQSYIDSVPSSFLGFFDSGPKHAIAKNLMSDGERISELAGALRQAAENGQTDAGDDYDWTRWARQASVIGGDLQFNSDLAWDASITGPLVDASSATAEQVIVGAEVLGNRVLQAADILSNPWVLVAGVLLVGLVLFGPELARAAKAAREVVAS